MIDLRPWEFDQKGGFLMRAAPDDDESIQIANMALRFYSEFQVEELLRQERERCAKVCDTHGGPVKWGSENSDRYIIQDEWAAVLGKAIRALPSVLDK